MTLLLSGESEFCCMCTGQMTFSVSKLNHVHAFDEVFIFTLSSYQYSCHMLLGIEI